MFPKTKIALVAFTLIPLASLSSTQAATPHRPPKVTLTIAVGASKKKAFGVVSSKKGKCPAKNTPQSTEGGLMFCGFRFKRGFTIHLKERPNQQKTHPFKFWVLPDGKKVKKSSISLKIAKNSLVEAIYKD